MRVKQNASSNKERQHKAAIRIGNMDNVTAEHYKENNHGLATWLLKKENPAQKGEFNQQTLTSKNVLDQ